MCEIGMEELFLRGTGGEGHCQSQRKYFERDDQPVSVSWPQSANRFHRMPKSGVSIMCGQYETAVGLWWQLIS